MTRQRCAGKTAAHEGGGCRAEGGQGGRSSRRGRGHSEAATWTVKSRYINCSIGFAKRMGRTAGWGCTQTRQTQGKNAPQSHGRARTTASNDVKCGTMSDSKRMKAPLLPMVSQ